MEYILLTASVVLMLFGCSLAITESIEKVNVELRKLNASINPSPKLSARERAIAAFVKK
jgi:hypothetical protein